MEGQPGDDGPDLTGWRPRYTRQTSRVLSRVLLVAITVQALLAVVRLTQNPDAIAIGLSVIVLASAFLMGAHFTWTPATVLDAKGIRVQHGFLGAQVISWARVREVRVQGRWEGVSVLVVDDGRTKPLAGLPVEHAQRLADALTAWTER